MAIVGFQQFDTAHQTHTGLAICAEHANYADRGISNLLITEPGEWFNSVPGHHHSKDFSYPDQILVLWVATHDKRIYGSRPRYTTAALTSPVGSCCKCPTLGLKLGRSHGLRMDVLGGLYVRVTKQFTNQFRIVPIRPNALAKVRRSVWKPTCPSIPAFWAAG
jgi:hypothetical protein